MRITILTDNPKSWFVPYGNELLERLKASGHVAEYVYNAKDIQKSDVCFILSCTKLVNETTLALSDNNIVVHASDLPQGKGFSPLQWQILEGKNQIPLTLFEVVKDVDAGPYYLKDTVVFDGSELHGKLREKLAQKIIEMCLQFVEQRTSLLPVQQNGIETFYKRRTEKNDELDANKTIAELFNQFRIADNENSPVYFYMNGHKYFLKIYPAI
ncbi:formyltransferase family protein [Mucilaginibacter panaciglaebae]|uniref:Formyl transferase N-terminal domain-containing protein n=1 Tax=Mucilaginibacter panaciglaebae TaxID=502331 RepID=A0ABP7WQH9_9SPHI